LPEKFAFLFDLSGMLWHESLGKTGIVMKQLGSLAKRTWPLLILLWVGSLIAYSLRSGFQVGWTGRALGAALFFWGLPVLVIGIIAAVRKQDGSVRNVWIAGIILFALGTLGQFSGQ
jgi:hypothetical protein